MPNPTGTGPITRSAKGRIQMDSTSPLTSRRIRIGNGSGEATGVDPDPSGGCGLGAARTEESKLEIEHDRPNEKSFLRRVGDAINPFRTRSASSLSSLASSAAKARADAEVEEKDVEIQEEISNLEMELEIAEVELESLKDELTTKTSQLATNNPLYDENSVQHLHKEIALLQQQLTKKSTDVKRLKITTLKKVDILKRKQTVLQKQYSAVLADIEEQEGIREDQYLGSDEECINDETNRLADRFHQLVNTDGSRPSSPTPEGSRPTSSTPKDQTNMVAVTEALSMQSKALEKLLENNQSSQSEKFLARQTTGKELPHFTGRPEEYSAFIADYDRTSKICQFSPAENMQRLRKCLKGEAAKSVQSLMISPENLSEVMETLKTRFGQPEHIVEAMIAKVREVPVIKEDKLQTIIELGTAVVNLTSTIKSLNCENHLSNPILLKELTKKLTPSYQMQWTEWVYSDENRKDNLENFTTWIKMKLNIACKLTPLSFAKEDKCNNHQPHWKRQKDEAVHVTAPQSPKRKCEFCDRNGHSTQYCRILLELEPDDRVLNIVDKKLCLSCLKPACRSSSCPNRKSCGINDCKYFHNKIFHGSQSLRSLLEERKQRSKQPQTTESTKNGASAECHAITSPTLRYVSVEVIGPKGKESILALLDDGSSFTMISEDVKSRIGVSGEKVPFCMSTLGGDGYHPDSEVINLKIRADDNYSKDHVIGGVKTVKTLDLQPVSQNPDELKKKYPHLRNIPLKSQKNVKPKMLIGSSHFTLISHLKLVEGNAGDPIAVKSRLGWAVIFPDKNGILDASCVSYHTCNNEADNDLHQLVKQHFRTEDFGVKPSIQKPRSKEDQRAIEIMEATAKRADDASRYQIGLLWKRDDIKLPESRFNALHRLTCQERKMDRDPDFASAYCAKIQEYDEKGFIKKLTNDEIQMKNDRTWYLPHFGVLNPNKPGKLRLVFDAAAQSHGVSLNDNLCQGPDLNNSIISVLLRFRQYKFAYAGDVRDMFHRVYIQPEDRSSQRFLWRGMNRTGEPDTYEMQVMLFGASSSPTCAQYIKNMNAANHENEYPQAAEFIKKNFYVDDSLNSSPTEEEAIKTINEIVKINAAAGFEVCNWTSNSHEILQSIPNGLLSKDLLNLDLEKCCLPNGRILGLWWNSEEDKFMFRLNFHKVPKKIISGEQIPTKRQILKLVMSIFDPLGFLAHLVVKAKILLQDVWRADLGWDEELTELLFSRWTSWIKELNGITAVKIRRCYSLGIPSAQNIQLHVFCDASEKAFCAIAFLRIANGETVDSNIIMAKTRVTPLKVLSIPRLELQSAVMGTRMAVVIKEELNLEIHDTVYWTDSENVLSWINSDSKNYKQFVSHRLGEILETSDPNQWRWVPTKENVADDGTRDSQVSDLRNDSRWFVGPKFLRKEKEIWPERKVRSPLSSNEDVERKQVNTVGIKIEPVLDISRFSNYQKLLRVTARVIGIIKTRSFGFNNINPSHLDEADMYWCSKVQEDAFAEEIRVYHGGKQISKQSRISQLDPIINEDGLLRVAGRTKRTNVPDHVHQPLILDNKHRFTKLLIEHYHRRCGHQGYETVSNELRQKYWILDRTSAVRKAFRDCLLCRIRKATPIAPRMAELPEFRLSAYVKPFTHCGLDYFGPIQIVVGRRREKRWGAIFTCLSTRAVHVELANSLTADSAINAIRRFGNRRGHPSHIYCDNGTNFKGADKELREALETMDQEKISNDLITKSIQFHYNPPAAPHMGGAWERMVGSIKKVLNSILKTQITSEEILYTFLTEAENIINSRPLTHVSVDPSDPVSITPNHFLLQWSNGVSQVKSMEEVNLGEFDDGDLLKKKWKKSQRMADMFWKQWIHDYLPTLTKRAKWMQPRKPIKLDDVVIVVDDQAPRNCWEKGRIIRVFPGKDGQIRMVDVKTAHGIYRRPATKIAVLDLNTDEAPSPATTFMGGRMSPNEQ